MKRLLAAVLSVATSVTVLAADLGVSVSIGQPGFYGHVDIGGYPPPQLIYQRPVVIERVPVSRPPIYLNVPPGQAKHWRRHCGAYNACGERVYFVRNSWYNHEYVPRYQEFHGDRGHDRRDERRGEYRGDGHPGQSNQYHGGGRGQGRDQ
ncbi:hypothetical protein [Accumulibacter sp.]|jgi:hypothetical protein|uniref:hypothetical protein n=1 Tax=Accumulibacter sp. TaxID=2053492 RepID=UPI002BA69F5C|nr:hypothetical protein [Accumulibacter sp.]HPU80193.1 hypothetical protein [Accumulibacter sp.]